MEVVSGLTLDGNDGEGPMTHVGKLRSHLLLTMKMEVNN